MMNTLEIRNLFNVQGKVVLVTGGSRGIGKMIATGFVKNGAKVYVSSRTAKDCQTTAEELNQLGPGTCIPIPADLQKYEEVERLVGEVSSRESALHVLVNNAGAIWAAPLDEYPDAAFSKVLNLNLQRVFTLTQKALPLLRAAAEKSKDGEIYRDPARIINIGSVEGIYVPGHDTYSYSAAKAALHHLSRHLAAKLGPDGVVSNTIACGFFPTKMTAHFMDMVGEELVAGLPLRRSGRPEDVAGTALFLSSPAGAYVNGATIAVDGGFLVTSRL
ncbi:short chain dehydrogenase reductase family [Moniliophthora roreri MCA 2997]|uniref:Short chain dehydrogenase reductase family n=1 Tax=Moniliophthora roreri (strain MCA 2997) TaxID=1381753 RepID=V2Z263_MONRO|nr:short chain dehydrogenase reductase family [Moniliophthora roreri MCA 2997]